MCYYSCFRQLSTQVESLKTSTAKISDQLQNKTTEAETWKQKVVERERALGFASEKVNVSLSTLDQMSARIRQLEEELFITKVQTQSLDQLTVTLNSEKDNKDKKIAQLEADLEKYH